MRPDGKNSPEADIVPNYPATDSAPDAAPSTALDEALEALLERGPGAGFERPVTLSRHWLPAADSVALAPRYQVASDEHGARIHVRLDGHQLYLDDPVLLEPVCVPKPWGQEIWFTGIEARGESRVVTAAGTLPLSQYLALAPRRLCRGAPLVLLKVLDPKPEPVLGDLYFEVHEQKQEVYVVCHVDASVWAAGAGRIRFGMNQALRAAYRDDAAFCRDYLRAVQDYERVRRAIDGSERAAEGTGERVGERPSAASEAALRTAMEAFTAVRELAVGDVVVVPARVPHSLQHGVRVIEFQTPIYERYIISFAQQVLTQDHWDTEAAVRRMSLEPPPQPQFDVLGPGVERIVAFDDFKVWRVTLEPGASFRLPAHPSYALCMVVEGAMTLGPLTLGPEQAAFVPAAALADDRRRDRQARVVNHGTRAAQLLVAAPDL
jgi:hypothetical protein